MIAGLLTMPLHTNVKAAENTGYITIMEGEDWGPAVTKLLVPYTNGDVHDYKVYANKKATTSTGEQIHEQGEVELRSAYRSSKSGKRDGDGEYTCIELEIHPDDPLTNPFYFDFESFSNSWADLNFMITHNNGMKWDNEITQLKPIVDEFKKGSHAYVDEEFGDITLQYAEDRKSVV